MQTQNPSLGNAQIVLNTHAEATFQIPDVTKVLAVPDLLRLTCSRRWWHWQRIESDLLNLYAQYTANGALGLRGRQLRKQSSTRQRPRFFSDGASQRE